MTEKNLQYDGYQWDLGTNFPGPRGPAGQPGAPGAAGSPGADGSPGIASVVSTQPVPSNTGEPGWFVVGAVYVPTAITNAVVEAIGGVSDPSLTLTVRLFSLATVAEVTNSRVTITSVTDVRAVSSTIATLPGTATYQVQAQAIGDSAGPSFFAVVKSVVINPG